VIGKLLDFVAKLLIELLIGADAAEKASTGAPGVPEAPGLFRLDDILNNYMNL
jgi:hypothetical protein